jgi:hypothetical protein
VKLARREFILSGGYIPVDLSTIRHHIQQFKKSASLNKKKSKRKSQQRA